MKVTEHNVGVALLGRGTLDGSLDFATKEQQSSAASGIRIAGEPQGLNSHNIRCVAVVAKVDPRSVVARLKGRRQRCTIAARIDEALQSLGFTPPPASQGT